MMQKHTAATLKFFLGQNVYDSLTRVVYELVSANIFTGTIHCHDGEYEVEFEPFGEPKLNYQKRQVEFSKHDFYPILRPADDLTDEQLIDFYGDHGFVVNRVNIDDDKEAYRVASITGPISDSGTIIIYHVFNDFFSSRLSGTPEDCARFTVKLLNLGFGAIRNSQSPTRYVDFIHGMPCYTPKMVEEMGL